MTVITDETMGYYGKIILIQPDRKKLDDYIQIYEHEKLNGKISYPELILFIKNAKKIVNKT